jgi:uncharacterized membrane protein
MSKLTSKVNFKFFSISISLGLILMSFQNCSMYSESHIEDTLAKSSSTSSNSETPEENIESSALKIIEKKCSSCHNENNPSGQISDLLSRDALLYYRLVIPGEPNISDLYTVIKNGSMPPAPSPSLTSAESKIIYDWIQDGFTDTSSGITPPNANPITLGPNFTSIKALILNTKCLGCHNANDARGGVNFSTYTSTMNTVQAGRPEVSSLYTETVSQRMPTGNNKLTGAELQAIQQWIINGAQNN